MRPATISAAIAAVLIALVTVVLVVLNGGGTQLVAASYEECVTKGGTVDSAQVPARCTLGDSSFTSTNVGY